MKITPGKLESLKRLSDSRGAIAAAAMDQRGALRSPIAKARGVKPEEVSAQDMGNAGVDTTYGDGFLRVDLAMQPIGTALAPSRQRSTPPIVYARNPKS